MASERSDLRRVMDKQEITDLVYTYAHAIDAGDLDRFVAIFTDDARFVAKLKSTGEVQAEAAGADNLRAFAGRVYDGAAKAGQSNVITQPLVALDGEAATSVCYFNLFRVIEGERVLHSSGRYIDDLVWSAAAGWRIRVRTAELGHTMNRPKP